jgi:hypothetical protein
MRIAHGWLRSWPCCCPTKTGCHYARHGHNGGNGALSPASLLLTGAMSPLGFEGSDALQNLTESLFAAQLLSPGVSIVIHGQVFPVDRARKDKKLSTFVAIGEGLPQ